MTDPQSQSQDNYVQGTGKPEVDLEDLVMGLVNAVTKATADETTPYNLTPLEFTLLRICMEKEECTATELAVDLPVDASRISRLVTKLFDDGLLLRRRLREDRRVVMLRLSEEGSELVSTIHQRIHANTAKLTENVSSEEMSAFASVASKILANHENMDREGKSL